MVTEMAVIPSQQARVLWHPRIPSTSLHSEQYIFMLQNIMTSSIQANALPREQRNARSGKGAPLSSHSSGA
jgi:hypothetical protein